MECDLSLLQLYRPISLLNVDYKIMTTILSTTLNKIIGSYIHSDQAGFIKNQQLRYNIRRICNIMNYVQGENNSNSDLLY